MRDKVQKIVDIIGYDCGWGCADYGCEDGPAGADIPGLKEILRKTGQNPNWRGTLGLKQLGRHDILDTKEKTLPLVTEGLVKLSDIVSEAAEQGNMPFVIGGDHSSAVGTWSGVTKGLRAHEKFGLIWIDAHLDCHTYETSHQGKWGGWWHGQPIAALMGQGLPELASIGGSQAKISPHHISIIGAHSYEPAEKEFIEKNGIRVFFLEEVQERGFNQVFNEARERACDGTSGFGLSIDLDAFHGSEAPGVGTAENRGLHAASVLPILNGIAGHPLFRALEIVEFNPHNDKDNKTQKLIHRLTEAIFTY